MENDLGVESYTSGVDDRRIFGENGDGSRVEVLASEMIYLEDRLSACCADLCATRVRIKALKRKSMGLMQLATWEAKERQLLRDWTILSYLVDNFAVTQTMQPPIDKIGLMSIVQLEFIGGIELLSGVGMGIFQFVGLSCNLSEGLIRYDSPFGQKFMELQKGDTVHYRGTHVLIHELYSSFKVAESPHRIWNVA